MGGVKVQHKKLLTPNDKYGVIKITSQNSLQRLPVETRDKEIQKKNFNKIK